MSTAPEIVVRPATNADGEKIRHLIYSVLEEYDLVPEPAGTDADIENVEANYIDRGGVFEVLEDAEGRLFGTVGLYPMDEKVVELRKMYFARELRGHGHGKKTLTRMIERARELGYKRIYLETASQLNEAIGLYKSYGFTPTCEGMHSERCDQAFFLDL
jgi:N-acetylglutamate synthase-like GNAT family acetyltransferase